MSGLPVPFTPSERVLEQMRTRVIVGAALFAFAFLGVGLRLTDATLSGTVPDAPSDEADTMASGPLRADIVDRNGVLLATTVPARGLYANARLVVHPEAAALRLVTILPDLALGDTARKLASDKSFVWLRRVLTPRQVHSVNRLGEPGLDFERTERRIYPASELAAHILGYTDADNRGLAGIEARFDSRLRSAPSKPARIESRCPLSAHRA